MRLLRRAAASSVEAQTSTPERGQPVSDRGKERANGNAQSETIENGLDQDAPGRTSSKGRPTPKRREAQRRRTGPVAPPPRTRREAYRRQRELNATKRSDARQAMRAGEDKFLPRRDQGPVRALVRDIVDSRRNAGGLFLTVAVIVMLGYVIPNPQIRSASISLWMGTFALIIFDSIMLGIRIRKKVRQRFPDSTERTSRLIWYGVSRTTMIRRWRMPGPRVRIGDSV